jgi:hypothetical protein
MGCSGSVMGDPKDADPSIIEEGGIFDITSFLAA